MWKKIALGAALIVAVAAPGALRVMGAARVNTAAPPAKVAADKPFVATCKANQIVDSRPDPAWVDASFAHDNCWAPRMPAPMDGYTATRPQIVAGMAAEKSYAALSDRYQKCIGDFVVARKTRADKERKSLAMTLIVIENHRITASQENKKKAAAQMAAAIDAFNEYGSECL
jgi:hypothetical protein